MQWIKIGGEKREKYRDTLFGRDRVSFVFKTQDHPVDEAYSILNQDAEEEVV